MSVTFELISTWDPAFVTEIRKHYTQSRGSPPGKKLAWRILEGGVVRGHIGLGEPAYKLSPRRRLGIEDARPLPFTVCNFIYRISDVDTLASEILKQWHEIAAAHWADRYGWVPVHWESLCQRGATRSEVVGACFRRAGYRSLGDTTGRSARRPAGNTHGARVWVDAPPKTVFYRGPLDRLPAKKTSDRLDLEW